MIVLVARHFPRDTAVIYYYGFLGYQDLQQDSSNIVVYGYGTMEATAERFLDTAMELSVQVRDDDGTHHKFFVAPPSLCAASY